MFTNCQPSPLALRDTQGQCPPKMGGGCHLVVDLLTQAAQLVFQKLCATEICVGSFLVYHCSYYLSHLTHRPPISSGYNS